MILIALLLGGGCIYYLNEESSSRDGIEIDGNAGDWAEIETQELVVESSNSNIDLEAVAVSEDEIYLSILTVTKEPLFFSPDGHTLRIFLDTDDSFETGYFIPGMGADYLIEIFGQKSPASTNVTILSSVFILLMKTKKTMIGILFFLLLMLRQQLFPSIPNVEFPFSIYHLHNLLLRNSLGKLQMVKNPRTLVRLS